MSAEAFLEQARRDLRRVTPEELAGLPDALVVDIRPHHDRLAEGEVPGSVPVERIVLEWRLDPHGEHRIPGFDVDTTVVVLCNEGYASSLAARDLQRVGLPNATDLVGGFRGYAAAGLPVRAGATPAVT
ncbi:rhodanese-related sulfurtransferase [Saccharothrix tamanrassetensis]|uniref:Rhodanese-related sulfurtransferase n=1 Tax=Saccharothrix tamanrassetensis TaxID=1051531 RepID=A0A841CDM0_9PSEU|nr:rhodanese-like domain-containing protein [Saccharothrix tamanrassetensis]MBB5955361.1 rhodanese-related sulfurtransferase [Saccharothrix tamanrassetensis]